MTSYKVIMQFWFCLLVEPSVYLQNTESRMSVEGYINKLKCVLFWLMLHVSSPLGQICHTLSMQFGRDKSLFDGMKPYVHVTFMKLYDNTSYMQRLGIELGPYWLTIDQNINHKFRWTVQICLSQM